MTPCYFLCLDPGGSSSRALLISDRGEIITEAQVRVKHFSAGGRVEQDSQELVASLQVVATQALAALAPWQRQCVRAAGLVCQRSSLVAWRGDNGEALTPVLSWQDTRAAHLLPTEEATVRDIQRRTGLRVNAHAGASKMAWLLANDHAVRQAQAAGTLRLTPLASFLGHRLLREKPRLVDRANAQRTLLMNLQRGQWDKQLLALFGIPQDCLASIIGDSDLGVIGHLALPDGAIPLTVLSGDQSAAVYAGGALGEDELIANMGTGAFLLCRADGLSAEQAAPLLLSESCVVGRRLLEATVNGAGSALDWLAEQEGIAIGPALIKRAMACETELLFINTVGGLGSPDWRQLSHLPGNACPIGRR